MAIKALVLSQTLKYVSDKDPCKKKVRVPVDPEDPKKGTKEVEQIEEGATYFILKPLDVFLMGHIYDSASMLSRGTAEGVDSNTIDIKTRVNQTNIEAVRFGLAGFENFQDVEGHSVNFKTGKTSVNGREYQAVSDHILRMFGTALVGELSDQIKKISEVSKDEEGNSEQGSQPFGSSPKELVLTANGSESGAATPDAA